MVTDGTKQWNYRLSQLIMRIATKIAYRIDRIAWVEFLTDCLDDIGYCDNCERIDPDDYEPDHERYE
jgi:hypothetical protein